MIVGLGKIAEDYDHERSVRNRLMKRWGRGNQLGALYVLTEEDIECRLGDNDINGKLKEGDKAVCMEHSGDCFSITSCCRKLQEIWQLPKAGHLALIRCWERQEE